MLPNDGDKALGSDLRKTARAITRRLDRLVGWRYFAHVTFCYKHKNGKNGTLILKQLVKKGVMSKFGEDAIQ